MSDGSPSLSGAVDKVLGDYDAIGDEYAMFVRGRDLELTISDYRRNGSFNLSRYAEAKGDLDGR